MNSFPSCIEVDISTVIFVVLISLKFTVIILGNHEMLLLRSLLLHGLQYLDISRVLDKSVWP